jgi:heme-degrading monooxygenase HmoA
MIVRTWHGYTTPENATAYEQLLKEEVFKEIKGKNINGFKGIRLLRKDGVNEVTFMTLMSFDNIEAVKQFAGEDYEQAYVPDAARKILSRFDDKAVHYELVHQLPE